jgi:hypothetical protein
MQFRFTLSEDDLTEKSILDELRPLNARRRSEYFRKILAKGFIVELSERGLIDRHGGSQRSREQYGMHDYNGATMAKDSSGEHQSERLDALKLVGIFRDQSESLMGGRRAAINEGGEQ